MSNVPDYLLTEAKLSTTPNERDKYDNLATLYEILLALDHLEKLAARDAIETGAYVEQCKKLLNAYKVAVAAVPADTAANVEKFTQHFRLNCKAAFARVQAGAPASVDSTGDLVKRRLRHTVGASQHLVTVLDALQMGNKSKDKLQDIPDLNYHLDQLDDLPADHPAKVTTKKWLDAINAMSINDELTDDQVRQAAYDFDAAQQAFKRFYE